MRKKIFENLLIMKFHLIHIICLSVNQKNFNNYYNSIFPWLERCEKIFGFNLDGYGLKKNLWISS